MSHSRRRRSLAWAVMLALAGMSANASLAAAKTELWVYTSIYKEFAQPIEAAFEKLNPGIDAQLFQAGSEKIQAKFEAEMIAKKPQADLIITSDPFWTMDLWRRGLAAGRAGHEPVEVNYNSLMVMIVHRTLPADQRPQTFFDMTKPSLKGLVQIGSPLESGTVFASVAYLSKKYGWDFFAKLRDNKIASSGGNSTVIQKVESGEKKVGMVLLENALAAQKRKSPIDIIYPADGAIAIPSVQMILKDSKHQEAAGKFADFILSEQGQTMLRAAFMYPVNSKVSAPEGAKPLAEVTKNSTPWTNDALLQVADSAKDIKKKFAALILD